MEFKANAAMRWRTATGGLVVAAGVAATLSALARQPMGLPIPVCAPAGLAVNSKNELFVANHYGSGANCGGGQIIVYDSSGKQLPKRTITANVENPQGLAFDMAGRLYVLDLAAQAVFVYSRTGKPLPAKTLQVEYDGGYAFAVLFGVQIAPNGDVWVAGDTGLGGIVEIFRRGKMIGSINDQTHLPSPVGIAFQPGKKRAWIANGGSDYEAPDMDSFSLSGALRAQFPLSGFSPGYLAFQGANSLLVTVPSSSDVLFYDTAEQDIVTVVSDGLAAPNGIAIDSTGNFYVANGGLGGNFNGSSISKYSSSGSFLCAIVTSGCY